jgi:hypothetical protein
MPVGARVRHLIAGADVWSVERIREGMEGEAKIVVDGVSAVEGARDEERIRVLDSQ